MACGWGIKSHVGVQLLLSDERCDVNLLAGDGYTALMMAVRQVVSEDDTLKSFDFCWLIPTSTSTTNRPRAVELPYTWHVIT